MTDEESEIFAVLYDSAYIAGAKAGFNLGLDGNSDGLSKLISARDGYLKYLVRTIKEIDNE